MNWMNILTQLFEVVIIPLLGIATLYVVALVKAKTEEIKAIKDNELFNKYMDMLCETITDCTLATTQTYVDALKKENAFDKEAQAIAFQKTFDAIMSVLSEDAKEYLTHIYGDLTTYITARIEAEVKANK